jgi:ATP-dependent helicase/nuclease subunit A
MIAPRNIPETVTRAQVAVSNPDAAAWVAANAGSGKTHVLAQRVIRLLLSGVEPARILCITFTKAAAANMANRVFGRLAEWTALDDAALDAALRAIGESKIDATRRARARQLFALTLETPGGLKVQTIHAFCTHLLHSFPFEADVAARFEVLDEAAEAQLLDRQVLSVLLDAAAQPGSPRGRALTTAIATAADETFRDLLSEAIKQRDKIKGWIDGAGGVDGAIAELSAVFGVDADDTEDKLDALLLSESPIRPSEWPAVAAAFAEGSKTDQEQGERFRALSRLSGAERAEIYLKIFCTDERSARVTLITKPLQKKHAVLAARLLNEQKRVCALLDRKRAVAARERTAALITIAAEIIDRYRAEKSRRGLLDYDDLIDKALAMLNSVKAAWVHYKLDRGIDHVLIDEAQDTSPKQWAIIEKLTEEFFAGAGARDFVKRTIFAVGDEKQSIFSFQGAAPKKFADMRRHFEAAHARAEQTFIYRTFDHSFRSGVNVLSAVDRVFSAREIFVSVTADAAGVPAHVALPEAAPGLVEIWDTFKPEERPKIEAWDAPFDRITASSPQERLARKIASTVRAWRGQGMRPGDVLILVRRRGPQFEAIIRALKDANIPVAGADRLVLTDHIAVMDLMALADALLLPDDDLALATVLKSPLFGFDDEMLFRIAWNRKGTLRAALREQAGDDPRFAAAAETLNRLADAAVRETPFAFYARLLNAEGGRARMLARLGHEAADALDEFLELALKYEQSETPSLQGFVAWLHAAKSEIKRDMEITRDEVRVMTVHGAKGLEARAVILADTTTPPWGWHPPRLLAIPPERAAPGAPERLIWALGKKDDVSPMAAAREAALCAMEDEYRRLLYVAMTRAAERLIVCGTDSKKKRPDRCWYDLVHDALEQDLVQEPADDGDGTVWRYRKAATGAPAADAASDERQEFIIPAWLRRDAPTERPRLKVIAPSRAFEDASPLPAAAARRGGAKRADRGGDANALIRGTLFHRLMQSLPDIAPEHRAEAARRFLSRPKLIEKLNAAERDAIVEQVLALIEDKAFSVLFAPGSRAEVPIVGRDGEHIVVGQVDRLAVTSEAVLIADYKTNRWAPLTLDDALARHPEYVVQLARYRMVLKRLYPDRTVRAALVWTEVPLLMEIPGKYLDAAPAETMAS